MNRPDEKAGYPELFRRMRAMAAEYGTLPPDRLAAAFSAAGFGGAPWVRNRRVKGLSTRPAGYGKKEVAEFTSHPDTHERELRAVERALEYTCYPMAHTRMVYQNLLTYHNYIAPRFTDASDADTSAFWREWRTLERLRTALRPEDTAHELAGRAIQEGKVFVVPRVSVDKRKGRVEYAFLQRLPSDYVKIVGYNNVSKYTVAFNMMYFAQHGTDWRQYGDLFEPYVGGWLESLSPAPSFGRDGRVVYAARQGLDMRAVRRSGADAFCSNGGWYYWVTLPAERVYPFEIDDTDDNVLPVFSGMFLDMLRLSQMEDIQLELLQNPLVAVMTGEIPYWDDASENTEDRYKLSPTARKFFETLWNEVFGSSGIGFYAAPLKNMKISSLAESANANEIVSQGYTDVMAKAGLTALIPVSGDARAGAVNVSLAIESRMPKTIYTCYERMMAGIIAGLDLKYDWVFRMFGDVASDKERETSLRADMTLGILPAAIEYNAMRGRSVLDDLAWSSALIRRGLMSLRVPLVSSYNAADTGRPKSESVSSDGNEQDQDS